MATSNMPIGSPSRQSTALFVVDCGQYCDGRSIDRVKVDVYAIINNGRMPSSLILDCSRCTKSINWRANPDVETTDWRARRGKTAHRVRREGTAIAVPYPYPEQTCRHSMVTEPSGDRGPIPDSNAHLDGIQACCSTGARCSERIGHPRASARARRRGSGSTATGWVTVSSKGRSLWESL